MKYKTTKCVVMSMTLETAIPEREAQAGMS
jgi:hypothetical protein